ncbi:MAG: Sec-independent protein translocase protein TatB [Gammaproteobacteria bacterium]|nr:Sec-independent protein translocase protein TatB [Gammaproteobacteria bacterium]
MFDMGFTEMMLIGIVALIVIGPERLPGVARTAGKYIGRLKRFVSSVRADVEQELRADELREILAQQQRELDTLKTSINEAGREIEKEVGAVEQVGQEISADLEDTAEAVADNAKATAAADAAAAAEPAEPESQPAEQAASATATDPEASTGEDSEAGVDKAAAGQGRS